DARPSRSRPRTPLREYGTTPYTSPGMTLLPMPGSVTLTTPKLPKVSPGLMFLSKFLFLNGE
ncbi:MAG: hypothetical protein QXM76_02855, partial [Zestosphaera sp.]